MKPGVKFLWPIGAALALVLPIPLLDLHLIHTESAPIGLWRARPASPHVGDVARFCMRLEDAGRTAGRPYAGGANRGPCPYGTWMLAKPVVAGFGDTVIHTPEAVLINGRALPKSGTRLRDSMGRRTPAGEFGQIVLGPGELWVHSPYADGSFDSRYLGAIRRHQQHGMLEPIITWLTPSQLVALRARGLRGRRCGLVACVQRGRSAGGCITPKHRWRAAGRDHREPPRSGSPSSEGYDCTEFWREYKARRQAGQTSVGLSAVDPHPFSSVQALTRPEAEHPRSVRDRV